MDGFLKGKRYLILDGDALFADRFKAILRSGGTKIVHKSIQAPNMNAFAERFVLSVKSECLDRVIFVGGDSLDRAIRAFAIYYHAERPHQGLQNALICGGPTAGEGPVEVRERLGPRTHRSPHPSSRNHRHRGGKLPVPRGRGSAEAPPAEAGGVSTTPVQKSTLLHDRQHTGDPQLQDAPPPGAGCLVQ